jgi:chromosome segregation ATPase
MHSIAPDAVPTPPHPSLSLAAYAERFFEGRRVLVVGDATTGLANEILARGARQVLVLDPDAARAARASTTQAEKGLTFAVLRDDNGREGAFDACLIPDLSLFTDPRALLARVRPLVAAGAVTVVATPRVDGKRGESFKKGGPLNYYDFYDALVRHFPAVKMVGQVPFQGFSLVDFSNDEEPEVSVDASLVDEDSRQPIAFVAVASDRKIALDPYAIVQMPTWQAQAAGPAASSAELDTARLALVEARARADALRAELESTKEARRQAEQRLAEETRRQAELSRALHEAGALPRQLEQRLTEEARRAELLSVQATRAQEANAQISRELRAQQEKLQQQTRLATEAQAERARLASREEALSRRLRELEAGREGERAELESLRSAGAESRRVEGVRRQAEIEARQAEADKLRAEFERLRAEADKLRSEADKLRGDRTRTQAEGTRQQAEIERLRAELSARQNESSGRQAELGRLRAEVEALRQNAEEVAAEREALGHRALRAEAALEEFRSEVEGLQESQVSEVTLAEATLRERAREIAALRFEIDRRGAMVRELLEALEARENPALGPTTALHQERLTHLERELGAARTRLEGLGQALTRREVDISTAHARTLELTKALEQARAEAGQARAEAEQARAEAEQAHAEARHHAATTPAAHEHESSGADVVRALATDNAPSTTEVNLLVENDALRVALLQEHKSRLAAEAKVSDADQSGTVIAAQAEPDQS